MLNVYIAFFSQWLWHGILRKWKQHNIKCMHPRHLIDQSQVWIKKTKSVEVLHVYDHQRHTPDNKVNLQ